MCVFIFVYIVRRKNKENYNLLILGIKMSAVPGSGSD